MIWKLKNGNNVNIQQWIFFFLLCRAACGILVPQPGIEPVPPALGAWSLNHWTAREVPQLFFPQCEKKRCGFFFHIWIYVYSHVGGNNILQLDHKYQKATQSGSFIEMLESGRRYMKALFFLKSKFFAVNIFLQSI